MQYTNLRAKVTVLESLRYYCCHVRGLFTPNKTRKQTSFVFVGVAHLRSYSCCGAVWGRNVSAIELLYSELYSFVNKMSFLFDNETFQNRVQSVT